MEDIHNLENIFGELSFAIEHIRKNRLCLQKALKDFKASINNSSGNIKQILELESRTREEEREDVKIIGVLFDSIQRRCCMLLAVQEIVEARWISIIPLLKLDGGIIDNLKTEMTIRAQETEKRFDIQAGDITQKPEQICPKQNGNGNFANTIKKILQEINECLQFANVEKYPLAMTRIFFLAEFAIKKCKEQIEVI